MKYLLTIIAIIAAVYSFGQDPFEKYYDKTYDELIKSGDMPEGTLGEVMYKVKITDSLFNKPIECVLEFSSYSKKFRVATVTTEQMKDPVEILIFRAFIEEQYGIKFLHLYNSIYMIVETPEFTYDLVQYSVKGEVHDRLDFRIWKE